MRAIDSSISRWNALVRFAAQQQATTQALGVGGGPRRRVGCVADDAALLGVDQINVAGAAPAGGQQPAIGRRHRAVRIDTAVVQRLVDHRRVRWRHAGRHKAKRGTRVFVKAGQVDRRLDGVGLGVDDHQGVGVFVGDEDAVTRVDVAARCAGRQRCCWCWCGRRGLGLGQARAGGQRCGGGRCQGKLEDVAALGTHGCL